MERRKLIVLTTAIGIAVLTAGSVGLYAALGAQAKMIWLFYLIVISAWTSFFGVLWSLFTVWKFYTAIDQTRAEFDERLRHHYGHFFDLLKRFDERWERLPDRQKRIMTNRLERSFDRVVGRLTRERSRRRKKI